ncbi:60S ribosomal protein L44 [Fonticula alba]|uniref:60S ribosomal protein L44 n=1 Tax=Fonticula alba TaxID=691883 RepID=A0A058Z700_FONAL|nr:60S ribosomal protein L44 [Fonticula alba]KCV70020.1 60S ribosomal protein L44 [Fonticula alba]|eukprot:XP_009495626.1 60S ribosomal protein L44 [Fonticula alba]
MVNFPKTRRSFCASSKCRKHTQHRVTQYRAGKRRFFAQGERRYRAKQAGFGGQTKPIFHKKAKVTRKITLRLECSDCSHRFQFSLKRCKSFELGGATKSSSD